MLKFEVFIAVLLVVLSSSYGRIEQIHLSIAGKKSNGISITWMSDKNQSFGVHYGKTQETDPFKMTFFSRTSSSSSYNFCYYVSKQIQYATLINLEPNTKYYYIIQDAKDSFSYVYSFVSLPKLGDQHKKITFGIIGDLGQTSFSMETLAFLERGSPDLTSIIHAGDLSYADTEQSRWDRWGQMIEPLSSKLTWMVAPGNHEIELSCKLVPFVAYQKRFHMPHHESGAKDGNLYYSYDVASAHIIVLNTYAHRHSKQYKWLVNDLKKLNRHITPWLFVVMHGPWYNSNKAHQSVDEPQWRMKKAMEELFYLHHVNLVIAGHVHAYERSYPVYKEKRNDKAPTYIVVGDGGNREGIAHEFLHPKPVWSAFRRGRYGYGILKVQNATHALFDWHEDEAKQQKILDSVWIKNSITVKQVFATIDGKKESAFARMQL